MEATETTVRELGKRSGFVTLTRYATSKPICFNNTQIVALETYHDLTMIWTTDNEIGTFAVSESLAEILERIAEVRQC